MTAVRLAEPKQAHRRSWASGSYATVAERLVDDVPPRHLLARAPIAPGMEVLDVATGTGNVAVRAAQLGARVTGVDITRRRRLAGGVGRVHGDELRPAARRTAEAGDDDRWNELREELVALTGSLDEGRPGALRVESEYLLTLGRVGLRTGAQSHADRRTPT